MGEKGFTVTLEGATINLEAIEELTGEESVFVLQGETWEDTFAFKSETDALLFLARKMIEDGNWALARTRLR